MAMRWLTALVTATFLLVAGCGTQQAGSTAGLIGTGKIAD